MIPLTLQRILPVVLIGIGTTLASCWGGLISERPEETREEAYVPVYEANPNPDIIKAVPAKPIVNGGKIYVLGNLLFQVETQAGIHVIDYTDKQNPVKKGFIYVAGCSDIAVKGNHLLVNHMNDLVTIDITSPTNVKEVARIKNAFPYYAFDQMALRPSGSGYFVCPDYRKGYVKGWKLEKNVKNAHCFNP